MKLVAMIPARLGSKRVKSKNLRLLDGRPLVSHVAEKAKLSGCFEEIYINSESDVFESLAKEFGVNFYQRPMSLASDTATNDQFVLDFLDSVACDAIVQINPTSPLITADDIRNFVKKFLTEDLDTLHSVKKEQIEGLFKGQPLNYDPMKEMPPSQLLEPVMLFCSAIMAWRVENYRKNMELLGSATYGGDGKIGYFTLEGFSTIDVDNEIDFQMAELAIEYQRNPEAVEPKFYTKPSLA